MNCLSIKVPGVITDPGAPKIARDELIVDDNDGVAFLFDAGISYSWPGGNPIHGSQIKDLSSYSRHATMSVSAGSGVTHSGNGFDFSATGVLGCVKAPSSVAAALRGGSEFWLIAFYMKLPTSGDWVSGGAFRPWFQCAETNYTAGPEICAIGAASANQWISFRRATGPATVTEYAVLTPASADKGAVVQLAAWRTASGMGARLRSPNGIVSATAAPGVENSQDFSGITPKWGTSGTLWQDTVTAKKVRMYRGWMEDLEASGRDPITVLDADYARTMGRNAFV